MQIYVKSEGRAAIKCDKVSAQSLQNIRKSMQNSHQNASTTVWTQPSTESQRRYYSKHAGERRVFGWITTVLQTTHGFLAFAAWTAIYAWIFKMVPFLLPLAPILSGATLIAMHVLFRTTWETYWYDRLDNDPNTDSPVWVPVLIILCLLLAEVQGMQSFLAGQVKPVAERGTEGITQEHTTTLSAYEASYEKEKADIEAIYRQKEAAAGARFDRQIRSLVDKVSDTPADRAAKKRQVASLRAQRDAALQPVLAAKAEALEQAYQRHSKYKSSEFQRKTAIVAAIDSSNMAEQKRYHADMADTSTYSWAVSVLLLLLIGALSYRTVKINVESGILPTRNYTVLDAHGSLPERIWTALSDAINRRGLQLAVWLHRVLSPREAITTFDGTVVAKPGEYNTPAGVLTVPAHVVDDDHTLRNKVALKIMAELQKNPHLQITEDVINQQMQLARTMNGTYASAPFDTGKKAEPAPAPAQPAQVSPTPAPAAEIPYHERLSDWRRRVLNLLRQHDEDYRAGRYAEAKAINASFSQPHNPIVVEGNRLNLEWAIVDGDFQVRRRDRQHWTPLQNLSAEALNAPPANADIAQNDDDLFKQETELFKQTILPYTDDAGKVIGVKYRKEDGQWTTYDYNLCKGQHGIYLRRAAKEGSSLANRVGLAKWNYALSLFEEGSVPSENLQAITL